MNNQKIYQKIINEEVTIHNNELPINISLFEF